MDSVIWDTQRQSRTGIAEAVFCVNKSPDDLQKIIQLHKDNQIPVLLTRLTPSQWSTLPREYTELLDYCELSQTAMLNVNNINSGNFDEFSICIVTAGTSDLNIAKETQRTLYFNGCNTPIYADLGVAGLWRLMDKITEIRQYKIIIALAGMEGALFSVLAGLVQAPVIAVPTSVGYGVSTGGNTALNGALASCAPGILTMNIDNGFGAATAAIKILNQFSYPEL